MTKISFRDIEQLSASLDGQLSQAEKTRLESRIKTNPELVAALDDLRQARSILRRIPKRRAPRNFTLTPKMAGIRPPVPRAVPVLSWASAVAMLLFVCTLGTNLLGQFSFGSAAPMMAAAPMGIGGGPAATEAPAMLLTEAPVVVETYDNAAPTTTPETYTLNAPEPTPAPDERAIQPPEAIQVKARQPVNLWLVLWPALAILLLGTASLIYWFNQRAFRKKINKK
jgi:hypothetical protein